MKLVTILSMLILLSGCYNHYPVEFLLYTISKCDNNGGAKYISAPPNDAFLYAICNNGAEFMIARGEYE